MAKASFTETVSQILLKEDSALTVAEFKKLFMQQFYRPTERAFAEDGEVTIAGNGINSAEASLVLDPLKKLVDRLK